MEVKTYWKMKNGKLSCGEIRGVESVADAILETEKALKAGAEIYVPPILALLQGGKNGN